MNPFDYFHDPFLNNLTQPEKNRIVERLQLWGLCTPSFAVRLDNWFCNFDDLDDKHLALQVFYALKYYTENDFRNRLAQLYDAVRRHLADTGNKPSDIVLIIPDGHADSADRHAYDLVKKWDLLRNQAYTLGELSQQTFQDPVFVLFNDTHGTGNQFLREIWPALKQYGEHKIFVLAIAISKKALDHFRTDMPRVHVIPHIPIPDAWSLFTGEACERLRQIGNRVFPSHPMGYGDAGLLTAYSFQCPNNTLPIVWADGNNNHVEGNAYRWSPLFPYNPKRGHGGGPGYKSRSTQKTISLDRKVQPGLETKPIDIKASRVLSYRYRVGLLDLDLGLTNLSQLASELNNCQRFFHFTAPSNPDLSATDASGIIMDSQRNLSVYEIGPEFFAQFDEFAVDVIGCFTRYPLAFVRLDGTVDYNYISGPSNVDQGFCYSLYRHKLWT